MKKLILIAALTAALSGAAQTDYTKGVFIVNEDWYAHHNSTVNYLLPDDPDGDSWHYRVFQAENTGMELGCTAQYGAIHGGRFYFIAKQEKDPGAPITGGRITVADATTLKCIKQLEQIDPSGAQCDGRAFIGVDDHKGYISTSNGVWLFDLDELTVKGRISGTENIEGSLYYGQCGSMVAAGNYIFVAHQSAGILVIDPGTDDVADTIAAPVEGGGYGSVVRSADGRVWASVTKDTKGTGATAPCLVEINSTTLATKVHTLPDDVDAPANSWYAWTPDGFCASSVRNALYWNGGASSWFAQQRIYRYDLDNDVIERIIDLEEEGDGWNVYGCSMRPHPITDELYISLYVGNSSTTYTLRRTDYLGRTLQEYPMIANYWFPSLPVFPQDATGSLVSPPLGGGSGGLLSITTFRAAPSAPTHRACAAYSSAAPPPARNSSANNPVDPGEWPTSRFIKRKAYAWFFHSLGLISRLGIARASSALLSAYEIVAKLRAELSFSGPRVPPCKNSITR